jgi:hypothetical protein
MLAGGGRVKIYLQGKQETMFFLLILVACTTTKTMIAEVARWD